MNEVSTFRLYLLRATCLLIAVGLGITIWPGILAPPDNPSHMAGVVRSVPDGRRTGTPGNALGLRIPPLLQGSRGPLEGVTPIQTRRK